MNSALQFRDDWKQSVLRARYEAVDRAVATISSPSELIDAFEAWESVRCDAGAWKTVTEVRTRQDVSDADAKANAMAVARAMPEFQEYDARIKRALLASPYRTALESRIGTYPFERWVLDVEAFDSRMREHLERESRLIDQYLELLGTLRFSFRGETVTQTQLAHLRKSPDRDVRRDAVRALWSPFEDHAETLDEIFDALVQCRTAMARSIGSDTYTSLAYRRLGRTDYGVRDVQAFRNEIRERLTPLVHDLMCTEAGSGGSTTVAPWDELFDQSALFERRFAIDRIFSGLRAGFASIDPSVTEFVDVLLARGLVDLEDRPNKTPGGFCQFLPHLAMPFVFANVAGTPANVTTIAHELGHAFQNHRSRTREPFELVVPTNEAGEIHSMAMEFLLWPSYDAIFDDAADEFRCSHLRSFVAMLPYIAAVDHFQEHVYEHPSSSAQERHQMWMEVQRRYMPWRENGAIPTLARGAAWQAQRHVYFAPFYYIDYGIAACCALALWSESLVDRPKAIERYLRLCDLGGSLPFKQLVDAVQLRSPFERGTLTAVAQRASEFLNDRPREHRISNRTASARP